MMITVLRRCVNRFSHHKSYHVLITGSDGFIGSKLVSKMNKTKHNICKIDIRDSTNSVNISDYRALDNAMSLSVKKFGDLDFIVHLAAYWNYRPGNQSSYVENNLVGTENVSRLAEKYHVKRLIFASSISALPLSKTITCTTILNEHTRPNITHSHPYGWSKAQSENYLMEKSNTPLLIIRLTGVFDEWSNLPPLTMILNRWSHEFMGRIVPGTGNTGMPFAHVDDVVDLIEQSIDCDSMLKKQEIFMGSSNQTIYHHDLFPIIRKKLGLSNRPIYVALPFIKMGLVTEQLLSYSGLIAYPQEQMWMMKYIDNPIHIDSQRCQQVIDWQPKKNLYDCLDVILDNYVNKASEFKIREKERNKQNV